MYPFCHLLFYLSLLLNTIFRYSSPGTLVRYCPIRIARPKYFSRMGMFCIVSVSQDIPHSLYRDDRIYIRRWENRSELYVYFRDECIFSKTFPAAVSDISIVAGYRCRSNTRDHPRLCSIFHIRYRKI